MGELYDLSPALRLMLLGAVIALGPLAWVWLRHRRASGAQRLRALTLLTLFLTFDLVLFGAFTRLTDSGLGCPDWPGCYGSASPVGAHASISAAQQAMPTGPVTHSKAWVEMIHRYLATAVGVLILVLAVTSWMERRRLSISPAWAWLTLFWVCLQGAFGALTVTMKLFPAIVTLHLLGGMVLLALLRAQSVAYDLGVQGHAPLMLGRPARGALLLVYALLWLQIALGGWVSTNYAVLACDTFPTCQGGWWPPMNLSEGFTVWRELGMNADGQPITFAALTGIHYVHRLCAYLVLAALVGLAWQLWSRPGARPSARWLLALAGLQLATGLSNVVLDWPLLSAVGHTGGAAALVVVMTGLLAGTRTAPSSVGAPALTVPRTSP
ncbi:COX15/CtaA family protein [Hydrogenophaga pseudoflava]|uniref:COX15/CtaA family protein n=1 Tax=Hydrogenophaga pseudoflava TaxID=47421 RepID=UPI000826A23E|nr:COX15/CtaA family protein [Hydrogenophaga pseudoflava]